MNRTWTVQVLALVVVTTLLSTLMMSLFGPGQTPAQAGGKLGEPVFAQLSSMVSQKPKSTAPALVLMESNDALGGLDHNTKAKTADVIVKTPGVYLIMAAAQVGRETGISDDYVDMWVKVNGKDVDNSNTRQTIKEPGFTAVLVCQGIAELKAGDVVNTAFSVSSPGKGLGLTAISPKGEPGIPSIIFSMYKVN